VLLACFTAAGASAANCTVTTANVDGEGGLKFRTAPAVPDAQLVTMAEWPVFRSQPNNIARVPKEGVQGRGARKRNNEGVKSGVRTPKDIPLGLQRLRWFARPKTSSLG
jgi:hypothetical protein